MFQSSDTFASTSSKKTKETTPNNIPVKEIFERRDVTSKNTSVISRKMSILNNKEGKNEENKSNSIVSGSQRIKDLQELQKELSKSSYEPPKPVGMVIFFFTYKKI